MATESGVTLQHVVNGELRARYPVQVWPAEFTGKKTPGRIVAKLFGTEVAFFGGATVSFPAGDGDGIVQLQYQRIAETGYDATYRRVNPKAKYIIGTGQTIGG